MVLTMHSDLIEEFGGGYGLRDEGLLASAIARPQQLQHYIPESSIGQLAAFLSWGVIKNQPFIDGNKRIGFGAMAGFLAWNGYDVRCSEVEETAMVLSAAAGEMTEEQWTEWVVSVVEPIA
jgi:death-on-curing protein